MNPYPTGSAVGCRGAARDILVVAMAVHISGDNIFFKLWTHILVAFTASNNENNGRYNLRPDK
jgi:hypothetical protein